MYRAKTHGNGERRVSAVSVLCLAVACASPALAQSDDAAAEDAIRLEVSGEASVVAGVSDGDAEADADAAITFKASTVLDNGVEVGAVVGARVDGQQPDQIFGGGRYTSLLLGGPRGVGPDGGDAFVQNAYAYARGAFGQIIVGRDQGAARALAVTAPTIFRAINVNDWKSDLSGLNDVHTVNDVTGYATKITYLSPANYLGGVLGGVQLGVSYSPTLRQCGDDLCAPANGFVLAPDGTLLTESTNYSDAVEAALYYQKKISGDLLVGVGASYVAADEDARSVSPILDDYKAYSLGVNFAFRGITLGGSIKSTNAGVVAAQSSDKDGYLAFDAGITYRSGEDAGDWGIMFGYGQSEATVFGPNPLDPALFQDTQTAQAGVTYFLGRGITIGAAAQFVESTKPEAVGGAEEATSVVIESSIKF